MKRLARVLDGVFTGSMAEFPITLSTSVWSNINNRSTSTHTQHTQHTLTHPHLSVMWCHCLNVVLLCCVVCVSAPVVRT
jgi:hypothetical protein